MSPNIVAIVGCFVANLGIFVTNSVVFVDFHFLLWLLLTSHYNKNFKINTKTCNILASNSLFFLSQLGKLLDHFENKL